MNDRKNVIRGLEQFKADFKPFCGNSSDWARVDAALALLKEQDAKEQCLKTKCIICPHCDNCDVDENGLLKEQEAKKVIEKTSIYTGLPITYCPKCGISIDRYNGRERKGQTNYCPYCGQAVKWE